jgi:hypothetical protein
MGSKLPYQPRTVPMEVLVLGLSRTGTMCSSPLTLSSHPLLCLIIHFYRPSPRPLSLLTCPTKHDISLVSLIRLLTRAFPNLERARRAASSHQLPTWQEQSQSQTWQAYDIDILRC